MSFLDKLIKYNILNLNPEGISNVNFKIQNDNLKIQGFLIAKKMEILIPKDFDGFIEIDLVNEGHWWFKQKGTKTLMIKINE